MPGIVGWKEMRLSYESNNVKIFYFVTITKYLRILRSIILSPLLCHQSIVLLTVSFFEMAPGNVTVGGRKKLLVHIWSNAM